MSTEKIDLRKINKKPLTTKVRAQLSKWFVSQDKTVRHRDGRFKTGSGGVATLYKIKWVRVVPLILIVSIVGGLLVFRSNAATKYVYGVNANAEAEQFFAINVARRNVGVKSLSRNSCMDTIARRWTRSMAADNKLSHNIEANAALITRECGYQWSSAGENVGYGPTSVAIYDAFYKSKGHRDNMLNAKFNTIGIGSWMNSKGRLYITHIFMKL